MGLAERAGCPQEDSLKKSVSYFKSIVVVMELVSLKLRVKAVDMLHINMRKPLMLQLHLRKLKDQL